MNWPKKGLEVPSCVIHVWLVGCRDLCLGPPDFMTVREQFLVLAEGYGVTLGSRVYLHCEGQSGLLCS